MIAEIRSRRIAGGGDVSQSTESTEQARTRTEPGWGSHIDNYSPSAVSANLLRIYHLAVAADSRRIGEGDAL
jgi:hypothetical protein